MAFNGKWNLKDVSGAKVYFEAINSPEEHKQKLMNLAEAVKAEGTSIYVEELSVDKSANTLRRTVTIHGEKKKDSGAVQFGVEYDAKAADGRPAKVKLTLDSETKITRYENGDGFSTVTVFEASGDQLTITATGNGASMASKYQRI